MLAIIDSEEVYPGHPLIEKLKGEFDTVQIDARSLSKEDLVKKLRGVKYIINGFLPFDEKLLGQLEDLEYIGMLATGFNGIDLKAARRNCVAVTNVPDYSTVAVSQFAVAAILYIVSSLDFYPEDMKKGNWAKGPASYKAHPIMELEGMNVGIVGYGNIGKRVEKSLLAMGMKSLVFDKEDKGIENQVGLDELLDKSDIVSLHLPLNAQTENIINEDRLGKMKDGAILINTARGGLVDEDALIRATNSGKIYKAFLDVIKNEPLRKDDPLLGADNIILSPHIAWASKEARYSVIEEAYKNLHAYLRGEKRNRVD